MKNRIVLVEDDEMLLKSLTFFLKSSNYEIVGFENGLDAIEYINSNYNEIRLVITDLNLPFVGGQQVIHSIKQIENSNISIIVLTSSGLESTELEVFELGADEFISKPFSPAVLLKRIEKLINT
ncbi:MAG: response regulator transcription factor [Paludibacter sp.]|nr:response regulator transcription factor [Paludibacter sp.]